MKCVLLLKYVNFDKCSFLSFTCPVNKQGEKRASVIVESEQLCKCREIMFTI